MKAFNQTTQTIVWWLPDDVIACQCAFVGCCCCVQYLYSGQLLFLWQQQQQQPLCVVVSTCTTDTQLMGPTKKLLHSLSLSLLPNVCLCVACIQAIERVNGHYVIIFATLFRNAQIHKLVADPLLMSLLVSELWCHATIINSTNINMGWPVSEWVSESVRPSLSDGFGV